MSSVPGDHGVDRLRAAVLDAWRGSPTRLIEDARAEADLATVGYRDRLFTELAANAADAASVAAVRGRMAVWRDGGALHVANTGAPLTADGVASLLALRVSPKSTGTVGRFGVGFAAVVPVADRVEVRSRTAAIVFDRAWTARAITDAGIDADLAGQHPPLLRLAWTVQQAPADGFDTEIVLVPSAGVDLDALVSGIAAQTCDRLLELPALAQIMVDGESITVVRGDGTISFDPSDAPFPGAGAVWREARAGDVRWLSDGRDHPEVLRTPTPTDIEISVPARVIAPLPITPDRRHLMPGVDVGALAPGYVALVRAVAPALRPGLVPRALGRNAVDARLLEAIGAALRTAAWVPPAHGTTDSAPEHTVIIADLSDDLAACLGPVLASLAHPDVSGPAQRSALVSVGARVIGLADIAEALAAVERPAPWWAQLYEALAPLVVTGADVEELGALPVPRADGKRNIGARGLVFTSSGIRAPWAPMIAPDAVHPLLQRLGARPVGPGELLTEAGLEAALVDAAEHGDDAEVVALSEAVLALLAADADAVLAPAASAQLLLPDEAGDLVHVDELLLPEAPLAAVLGDDLPFALVDAELVERHGAATLRRAGAGWGFLTTTADWPTGPDHDLDDEERWWAGLPEPPVAMTAVRDLDLVPDDRWPQALALLAGDPATAPLLADRDGYTAWWLREHARIDGRSLGDYRAPDAEVLVGIVDPLEHPDAAALGGVLLDGVHDADSAALVLVNLGDPRRAVAPGAVVRAHGAVVAAIAQGAVDADALVALLDDPPPARTLYGVVADGVVADGVVADGVVPDGVVVIDEPHYLAVVPASRAVLAGLPVTAASARELAGLLDLPLASEAVTVRVVSAGRATTWDADPAAVAFAAEAGGPLPRGLVMVHDELLVASDGGEHRVRWWVDDAGTTHLSAGD